MRINERIENILKAEIRQGRKYFVDNSLEAYRQFLLDQIEKYPDSTDHYTMWHRTAHIRSLEELPSLLDKLKSDEVLKSIIAEIISHTESLENAGDSDIFIRQLNIELPKLRLAGIYDELYGIFFHYDSTPVFGVTCFSREDYELILDKPRYIKFEDGGYASDKVIVIDFSNIAAGIFSERYHSLRREFEFGGIYFDLLDKMHLDYTYLCLHRALKNAATEQVMLHTPISHDAIFYAGQHDCGEITIFVRNTS